MLLQTMFSEKLRYNINSGFRTVNLPLPAKIFTAKKADDINLVEMAGVCAQRHNKPFLAEGVKKMGLTTARRCNSYSIDRWDKDYNGGDGGNRTRVRITLKIVSTSLERFNYVYCLKTLQNNNKH
jgi:hypothetical protein